MQPTGPLRSWSRRVQEDAVRIALAGLATSHPFTDARTLTRYADLAVWEPDPERLDRFRAEHPEAEIVPDLSELLATRPDGIVLTVPTPEVAAALEPILATGRPCFVNKPAAATRSQLESLEAVVAPYADRVLSSSVLRFSPPFVGRSLDRGDVLAVRATVRHDVGLWASGYNRWQDDPSRGGGTLVTMGIHGVELLVALLGPDVRLVGAAGAVRHHHGLTSEDTGVLALRWSDGLLGTVEVLGVSEAESYTVTVHTARGSEDIVITGDEEQLGYRGTIDAFLAMVNGEPSPVRWEQTRAVLDVLVSARETG
jgi:predicted dehydrogenase